MWNVFNHFDLDGTGFITAENLLEAMRKIGKDMRMEEVEHMISEVDQGERDGKISYKEFKDMMSEYM